MVKKAPQSTPKGPPKGQLSTIHVGGDWYFNLFPAIYEQAEFQPVVRRNRRKPFNRPFVYNSFFNNHFSSCSMNHHGMSVKSPDMNNVQNVNQSWSLRINFLQINVPPTFPIHLHLLNKPCLVRSFNAPSFCKYRTAYYFTFVQQLKIQPVHAPCIHKAAHLLLHLFFGKIFHYILHLVLFIFFRSLYCMHYEQRSFLQTILLQFRNGYS